MNKLIRNIALVVFVLAFAVLLLREIVNIRPLTAIAKALVMPSLCVLNLQYLKSKKVRIRYIFAMFFYMMGDILLLFSSRVVFSCGMGAFFLGHLLFMGQFFRFFPSVSWWKLLSIQALSIALALGITFGIMKMSGVMGIMLTVYGIVLIHMICITALLGSKVLCMGAILFFISDILIVLAVFFDISFPCSLALISLCYVLSVSLYSRGLRLYSSRQ